MRGHVERRYTTDTHGRKKFSSGGNVLTGKGATEGDSGKPWRGFNPSNKNRHWAIPGFLTEQMPSSFKNLTVLEKLDALYEAGLIEIKEGAAWPTPIRFLKAEDGYPVQDIWAYQPYTEGTVYNCDEGVDEDVKWLGPTDLERLGYPTQKPLGILERIINSCCPSKGIVLDPFCGCGTTIAAAEKLGRKWIGIDITHLAIGLQKYRLRDSFGLVEKNDYQVVGQPEDLQSARQLAQDDRYQFQWWAAGLVGARLSESEKKKGADEGIDAHIYFHDDIKPITKKIIIQIKSGHVNVAHIRDLKGVLEREKAQVGAFITLTKPTKPMIKEAISAGFYKSPLGDKYPKIQILTIEKLLKGSKIEYPSKAQSIDITFKKAPKHEEKKEQKKIF